MDEKVAWANRLRKKLADAANYIGENAGELANVELTRIEKYADVITCSLADHDERKTIVPPRGEETCEDL